MVELFPLPNEGVLLPTRSATSRCLKTEYTDHQVRYLSWEPEPQRSSHSERRRRVESMNATFPQFNSIYRIL